MLAGRLWVCSDTDGISARAVFLRAGLPVPAGAGHKPFWRLWFITRSSRETRNGRLILCPCTISPVHQPAEPTSISTLDIHQKPQRINRREGIRHLNFALQVGHCHREGSINPAAPSSWSFHSCRIMASVPKVVQVVDA